ncbi:vacuolar transporter chaperone [Mortierella sp. AM989]|nr:vacuolar transporter chaperone [Mortierella sp. AM989]
MSETGATGSNHIHTTTMPPSNSNVPLLQATPGKRIALPVRVEPKVFFANERTFLSWLNFTVLLGSLAIGLLNFGDRIGRISAGVFTLVAVIVMVYALTTFHWRADRIRKRLPGPYDDRFGPTVLCIFILAAILINFGLRFGENRVF